MRYLTKDISKIFLVDFFTDEERTSSDNQITSKLETFLTGKGISVQSFFTEKDTDIFDAFVTINESEIGNGIIIHLIGHGDETAVGFGNANYFIRWSDIRGHLVSINNTTNDGLIMNTTIMCHGKNIFQLIAEEEKPFFAAIGSLKTRSLQAFFHNKELYEKCVDKDRAAMWLGVINENLKASQGSAQYELRYA